MSDIRKTFEKDFSGRNLINMNELREWLDRRSDWEDDVINRAIDFEDKAVRLEKENRELKDQIEGDK